MEELVKSNTYVKPFILSKKLDIIGKAFKSEANFKVTMPKRVAHAFVT